MHCSNYSKTKTESNALRFIASLLVILIFALSCFGQMAFAAETASASKTDFTAKTDYTAKTDSTANIDYLDGQQIVHVGFFHFGGYHDMDTAGKKSGYGYDFLQMIAGYANFKYIYVGYQKSWNDMLDMLDSGEIDMLTYAVKQPKYENRFDFSEHSIGTSSAILTTSASNAKFAANDYKPFDGMRVGMIKDANRKDAFDDYASEKGFSYTPVYYSDLEDMQEALAAGNEIDAMLSDELRELSDEVIIDKFDQQDIYVMVKKGNKELLNTIDDAIVKLNAADPGWELDLQRKYFLSDYSTSLSMTLTEKRYVEGLTSSSKKLKVLFNPVRYPLAYYENGKARGVLVDIFKGIAADYDLPYEFIKTNDADEYYKLRNNGKADIILDFAETTDEAEVIGYRLTSSYAEANSSAITLNNFSGTPQTAAVIEDSDSFEEIANEINPRIKITYYPTFRECVDAVKSGDVDCTYAYSNTAQIFVMQSKTNSIKATQLSNRLFQFRLAVDSDADMALYGLLNKATHSQSASETNDIVNSYLVDATRNYNLLDYLMDHPVVFIGIILIIMLLMAWFTISQKKNALRLKASNDALEISRSALEDALAEANNANAAKTRFLSQMSHDIRTPLNGIIGMTNIADERKGDPERVSDALGKIRHSSDYLLTLINDILDLNRIESGKVIIAHDTTDIRTTIEQCAEVLKGAAINRDLLITIDTEHIESPFVFTDALHVRQILINIISNAVKFTPDGGNIIFRAEGRKDAAGDIMLCRFEVTDTGIGMSEEFLDKIYEAFVQEDTSSARTQLKGSGLGMSIVKQFVDMLNGTINIKSHLNMGTSVVVELPFEIDKNAVMGSDEISLAEKSYDFNGVHILLAEDNEINVEIAKTLLENNDITVDTVYDGKEAVEAFAASDVGEYRGILMDVMMPNMDGYEATKTIRGMERQDAKTIPIIAMTANAFAEDVQAALDNGMNAHIAKPIDADILMQTLAKHIST